MQDPDQATMHIAMTLSEVLAIVRRRKWLAIAIMGLVISAAVAFTTTATPTYRAEAEVLIRTEETANLFPLAEVGTLLRSPSAEAGFLSSTEFESAAQDAAGTDLLATVDVGDVTSRVEPSLIRFTVESSSPQQAANVAQVWADTYVEMRHNFDAAEVSRTLITLESSVANLTDEKQELLSALEPIENLLSRTTDSGEVASLSTQRVVLLQQLAPSIDPLDQQLVLLNREIADLHLIEQFLDSSDLSARSNRVARVPDSPVSPSLPRNLVLGSLLGILLALGAVFLAESLDDGFRTTEDVYEKTGLRPLAHVPLASDEGDLRLNEAFQRLASSITGFDGQDKKVLVFTSASSGEAKSSTVAGVGRTLARHGHRTIVIGADLRRPTLASKFGQSRGPGLGEIVAGLYSYEECLIEADPDSGLHLLAAGTVPDGKNPAELLRGHEFRTLINQLRQEYDHILIDSPPLLPVVDALNIAEIADGVVLHVFAGRTRSGTLQRSLSLIEGAALASPVLGFVLTGKQARRDLSYYDYEYVSVGSPSPSKRSLMPGAIRDKGLDLTRRDTSHFEESHSDIPEVELLSTPMPLTEVIDPGPSISDDQPNDGAAFEAPEVREAPSSSLEPTSVSVSEVDFGLSDESASAEMTTTKTRTKRWGRK